LSFAEISLHLFLKLILHFVVVLVGPLSSLSLNVKLFLLDFLIVLDDDLFGCWILVTFIVLPTLFEMIDVVVNLIGDEFLDLLDLGNLLSSLLIKLLNSLLFFLSEVIHNLPCYLVDIIVVVVSLCTLDDWMVSEQCIVR